MKTQSQNDKTKAGFKTGCIREEKKTTTVWQQRLNNLHTRIYLCPQNCNSLCWFILCRGPFTLHVHSSSSSSSLLCFSCPNPQMFHSVSRFYACDLTQPTTVDSSGGPWEIIQFHLTDTLEGREQCAVAQISFKWIVFHSELCGTDRRDPRCSIAPNRKHIWHLVSFKIWRGLGY